MFEKLIFGKLGWKGNRWRYGFFYATAYTILFFLIINLSDIILGKKSFLTNTVYSIVFFILMFFVYQVKHYAYEKKF